MRVDELRPGDLVDLDGDPYACTCASGDPDCDPGMTWRFEYGRVDETVRETPTCIRVDFSNGESVGFPPDHEVTVFRDVAESVPCDTQPTTMTPNNHPEEGQP